MGNCLKQRDLGKKIADLKECKSDLRKYLRGVYLMELHQDTWNSFESSDTPLKHGDLSWIIQEEPVILSSQCSRGSPMETWRFLSNKNRL